MQIYNVYKYSIYKLYKTYELYTPRFFVTHRDSHNLMKVRKLLNVHPACGSDPRP